MYSKNPYEAKYQFLINKREGTGLKLFNETKSFIEYSNDMQVVYKNVQKYNIGKKRKILIVFDDMIVDVTNNEKLNPIVTELFIRGRKLHISIVFTTQSYFKTPKVFRLIFTYFLLWKFQIKKNFNKLH